MGRRLFEFTKGDIMTLNRIWIQNREMGNIARRMIWIPVVLSLVVIGVLAARTPHEEQQPVMAATPIPAEAPVARDVSPEDPLSHLMYPATPRTDAALAAHEVLDPVGAGHDTPR
jgi:hypothetical protein